MFIEPGTQRILKAPEERNICLAVRTLRSSYGTLSGYLSYKHSAGLQPRLVERDFTLGRRACWEAQESTHRINYRIRELIRRRSAADIPGAHFTF